jgi:hypothetical protein
MAMLIQPGLDNPLESRLTVVTQPSFRERPEIAFQLHANSMETQTW